MRKADKEHCSAARRVDRSDSASACSGVDNETPRFSAPDQFPIDEFAPRESLFARKPLTAVFPLLQLSRRRRQLSPKVH